LLCQYVAVTRDEAIAINSREELAAAENVIQMKLRDEFIKKGVTLIDKNTVYFSRDTKIENDVVIYPSVFFGPDVEVKAGSTIKSFSFLEGVSIGNNVSVGPFAYLRPGAEIKDNAQIGNFVEVKGSVIGKNAKVKHLSYIGDADIGDDVNIGAGTVICNYDGVSKHRTVIGAAAFIGSNTSLVAPVEVGGGAIVGAGSVITQNIPKSALSVARADQVNYENMATVIRDKKNKAASGKKKLL
jgi:bifunctional UDP-N-acetylglucosamine pyrophosphorylase / glucosamine-1-phosphate N-acetyltransferase